MVLPWLRMIYSRPAVETLSSLFSWVIPANFVLISAIVFFRSKVGG